MEIRSAKDLIVYQKAYQLAMAVFEVSKGLPGWPGVAIISSQDKAIAPDE